MCRSWHGNLEFIPAARLAAQSDLRIFCIASTRGRTARGDHHRCDRRDALRVKFRCEGCARLRLRSPVVQSLACFARRKPRLFRALSLALAQTSSRVSHHASRYHNAADRIPYRQNLGNRRNNHAFQRRTANKSASSRRTPAGVHDVDGIVKGYPAEFLHHPPTPQNSRDIDPLASGAHLRIIDYAPTIETKLNPKPLNDGGVPALHFAIATTMMNQHLDGWLLADDPQNGNFSMGLANIELRRGTAPQGHPESSEAKSREPDEAGLQVSQRDSSSSLGMTDLEESIFAFSKAPEEQIGHVRKGGSVGAKVRLEQPQNGNKGRVLVSLVEKEARFDVAENLGRDATIAGTPFTLKIDDYWADFRIENGKPSSLSDQPNNPAVLVTIRGKGVPANEPETNPHGSTKDLTTTPEGSGPSMPAPGEGTPNHLTLFIADDGTISYELASRKNGRSSGKIELDKPLPTGWADWQLTIDKTMPHAASSIDFNPVNSETASASTDLPDGVRVRIQQNGETFERWAPAGWQITIPSSPSPTMVAYGWKTVSLPIGLELLNFEVKRNEGSDSPAGFKSTVRIVTADGETA